MPPIAYTSIGDVERATGGEKESQQANLDFDRSAHAGQLA